MVQEGRLAGTRRGNDQAARAFAQGRDKIEDARGITIPDGFQVETLVSG